MTSAEGITTDQLDFAEGAAPDALDQLKVISLHSSILHHGYRLLVCALTLRLRCLNENVRFVTNKKVALSVG